MSKPTTVRLPEELLQQVDERARVRHMERADYLRLLIRTALDAEREEAVLADYSSARISAGRAAELLGLSQWELVELLQRRGMPRNVRFEDWLDSEGLGELVQG